MPPKREHEGTPVQVYLSDESIEFLDKWVMERKGHGDTQVSKSLLIRESLADRFGLPVEFFSTGEWGVRKAKREKAE